MANPSPQPIRIVIADDHRVVRTDLKLLLERGEDFEVVAEAGAVADALRYVRAHRPEVAVLDINMSNGSSLPALPEFREGSPDTRIVILTMQEDAAFAREALRAGASGYVLKEAADDELVQAVRSTADGGTFLNPQLGARIAAAPTQTGPPGDLTEREAEILKLIALGHTNGEIAQQLYLSVRTVESHRAHIQQKLRRTSRAELVRYALEPGLIKA